jgi:hypothetical protein
VAAESSEVYCDGSWQHFEWFALQRLFQKGNERVVQSRYNLFAVTDDPMLSSSDR